MDMKKAGPWLVWGWRIYAHCAGMAVIALAFGIGLVQAVSANDAVITATDLRRADGETFAPAEVMRATAGGRYRYIYNLDRHEACPGEVVIVFTTADSSAPAVITLRKPSVLSEVRLYSDVRVDNPLPDAVGPGLWDVDTSMVSHCANREQVDPIAKFRIEVTRP